MNELSKAMYINLDFQPERNFYMRAMLTGLDCRLDSIVRFPAKAGKDYPDKESICKAAVADGFPFLKDLFWAYEWMTPSALGLQWSWCSALRTIAGGEDITLLMMDDYTLRQTWDKFKNLVGSIDEDLKILQVTQWYPHFEDWKDKPVLAPRHIRHYNELLNYGFNGAGDGITIYSPAGAQMMLQWMSEEPNLFPELQVYYKSQTEIDGCFSVKYPYTWSGVVDRSVFEQAILSQDLPY